MKCVKLGTLECRSTVKIEAADIQLIRTCAACPEQHDVYNDKGVKIGTLRLRWGLFTAKCLGGTIIYSARTDGLRARLCQHYDALAEYLNQPENFSCEPTGPAGEESVTIRVHHYECEVGDDLLIFYGDQQAVGQVYQTFLEGLRATEQESDGCRCTWLDLANAYVDSKIGTRSCYSTGKEDGCVDLFFGMFDGR